MSRYASVAIVGVGLIGGSIGLALRQRQLAETVVGVGRRAERLRKAEECGAVDRTTTDLTDGVADAEIIVVCTPVGSIASHVGHVADACPPDAVITDAGSTKAQVVRAVEAGIRGQGAGVGDQGGSLGDLEVAANQRLAERHSISSTPSKTARAPFVGSHPIAGDHRTGVEYSRADLFEGRTVVVTLTETTPEPSVERVSQFWQALGAVVHIMTPEEHDQLLAAVSHGPHLAAAAVAAATPLEALPLSGTGWQDVTRIAGGDPGLWREIAASNRQHIGNTLARIEATLAEIRKAIETGDDDRLEHLLTQAKRIRNAVGS